MEEERAPARLVVLERPRLDRRGEIVRTHADAEVAGAAAEDQLEIWADRAGADIVRQDGADPASVVFDSLQNLEEKRRYCQPTVVFLDCCNVRHGLFEVTDDFCFWISFGCGCGFGIEV